MNGITAAILDQIRGLGYIVKEFRINGTVELHAVPLTGGTAQVARSNDGDDDDDDAAYLAACMLAEAVGLDLYDG